MKIGIIGIGVVGGAMYNFFKNKINLIAYDKYRKDKFISNFEDLMSTDIIFFCLPTPFNSKTNEYDKTAIYETCEKMRNYKGVIVIKSTIEPETTQQLCEKYNLNFVHNPEFLSAKTALEDFKYQNHIVLGKGKTCDDDSFNKIKKFYQYYFPKAKISICSSTESEFMKIGVNCFYATKIQFFNEIYTLCQKNGTNYDIIKNLMISNDWINPMHTNVPGTDGKLSYGGMCFPKDTNALLQYMKKYNSYNNVLESVILERNKMRNDNENVI